MLLGRTSNVQYLSMMNTGTEDGAAVNSDLPSQPTEACGQQPLVLTAINQAELWWVISLK